MSIPQVAAHLLTTFYTVANLGNSVNPAVLPKEVNPHTDTNSNSITRVVTSQLQTPSKEQRFEFQQAQVELQPQVDTIVACIKGPTQKTFFDNLLSRIDFGLDTVEEAMDKLEKNGIKAHLNLPWGEPFICPKGTPTDGEVIKRARSI